MKSMLGTKVQKGSSNKSMESNRKNSSFKTKKSSIWI